MDRPRLVRRLRIAWSMMCGVTCVLLIALWARSYWYLDHIRARDHGTRVLALTTEFGQLRFYASQQNPVSYDQPGSPGCVVHYILEAKVDADDENFLNSLVRFEISPDQRGISATLPLWFPAALCGISANACWFKVTWRFSVRALIIFTTLTAILLGLSTVNWHSS